ncbi:MAG: hypothetical protein IJW99_12365 [Clostridia bacterium]|nr:hypothetical protein [Clostridia bacterium]
MTNELELRNDRDKLCRAIKHIAWAYVLIYLDVNLVTLNILPNWLGFLLILLALPALADEVPSAALLRPFAILLAAWEGFEWLVRLFGASIEADLSFLILTVSVTALYFHFQLLTDLAALSEKYGCPQTGKLLQLRTVDTLIATALALPLPWQQVEWLTVTGLLVYGAIVIWICAVLFGLKRSLEAADGREEEGTEDADSPV